MVNKLFVTVIFRKLYIFSFKADSCAVAFKHFFHCNIMLGTGVSYELLL